MGQSLGIEAPIIQCFVDEYVSNCIPARLGVACVRYSRPAAHFCRGDESDFERWMK